MVLQGWHPFFWISLVTFFLYFKTLAFKFTYFDDNTLILDNLWYLTDIRNIFGIFHQTAFHGGADFFYRPLLMASLFLDALIGGASPVSYHFTNIVLHATGACLVFTLFVQLKNTRGIAFFFATLFAVHPALAQAVAWIPGRNDTLLGVFVLSAFICFSTYRNRQTGICIALHLVFFNLAIYTKETAFQLIPLCLLSLYVFEARVLRFKHRSVIFAGWVISSAIWVLLRGSTKAAATAMTLTRSDLMNSLHEVPLALLHYTGNILYPFNLSGYPITPDLKNFSGIAAVAVLTTAFAFTSRGRKKQSLFGLMWYLLFILPPFILPTNVHLDHRLYLPMIGIFIMLSEFMQGYTHLFYRKSCMAAAGAIILLLAVTSFIHSDIFISRLVFWKSAVASSPHSSSAHNSLGVRYIESGDIAHAELEFRSALYLAPGNTNAMINLSGINMQRGDLTAADRTLSTALALRPGDHLIWYNLGMLRYLQGNNDEALRCWLKAIECNPYFFYSYRTLAVFMYLTGSPLAEQYLAICKNIFHVEISIPSDATLRDRRWLYYYSYDLSSPQKH